ncbi:hypothetical protein FS749_003168 [Ceratobasidium sp. UAMH 11750]|nr:hypothetical protein FS749_003168 [Ceratobasidium sp. UAMH 11750]
MSFATSSLHPVNTSIPSLSGVLRVLAEKAKSTQPLDLQKILEQAASSVHAHESIVKMLRATSFPGRPNDSDDPAWVYKGYNKALSKLIQAVDNPPPNACAARVLFSNSLAWYLHEILKLVRNGSVIVVEASDLKVALLLTDMGGLLNRGAY